MTDNPCAICQRPQPDTAVACATCAARIARHLGVIVEYTPDARAVAAGQTRRGPAQRGNGADRLPINLAAGARLDAVQNALTTWARHVADERGREVPAGADPLVTAARWLGGHVEWARHRQEVGELARDVAAVVRVLTGVVDGHGERRWLGQCGAEIDGDLRCEGDVYGHPGAQWASCRVCGVRYEISARREWLDGLTRECSYTARTIEDAHGIKTGTIRQWVHRGLLAPDGEHEGQHTYPLQRVLDVAASEAVRRAEGQQRRARRTRDDGPTDPEGRAA